MPTTHNLLFTMEDLEEEDIRVTINKGAIRVTIQIQYVRERGGPARRA